MGNKFINLKEAIEFFENEQYEYTNEEVVKYLKKLKTIVLCKDCKYSNNMSFCSRLQWYNNPNDFCSRGVEKE